MRADLLFKIFDVVPLPALESRVVKHADAAKARFDVHIFAFDVAARNGAVQIDDALPGQNVRYNRG